MIWIVIVVVVVLAVLLKIGIFRKPAKCEHCGVSLKGTEQQVFGSAEKMILCKDCASKIHPQIMSYAKDNWNYAAYTDYLAWEEETKAERGQFKPDVQYGMYKVLMIDSEHGLFSIGKGKVFKDNESGLVLRFADLIDYEMNFKPGKVKEGLITDKVEGDEYAMFDMRRPSVTIEEILQYGVKLPLRKKGLLSSKYEYQFSKKFIDVMNTFLIAELMDEERRSGKQETESEEDIMKAQELFGLEILSEATKSALRTRRDELIRSFKPTGDEDSNTYSQRVNDAYDLLSSIVEK